MNYEKRHNLKDGKPIENPNSNPNPNPKPEDKTDDMAAIIANAVSTAVKPLSDELAQFKTEKSQATRQEQIMAKAKEYGISPDRMHIDPLVEMLCTSEDGIAMNVEVISTIREKYPDIHITAAVSNISFNLPVRKMVNLGFTVLAMNAGLDSAILDPTNRDMMGVIYATEALLGQDDYCMEYISAYREGIFGPKK